MTKISSKPYGFDIYYSNVFSHRLPSGDWVTNGHSLHTKPVANRLIYLPAPEHGVSEPPVVGELHPCARGWLEENVGPQGEKWFLSVDPTWSDAHCVDSSSLVFVKKSDTLRFIAFITENLKIEKKKFKSTLISPFGVS